MNKVFSLALLLLWPVATPAATYVLPPDDVDIIGAVQEITSTYEDTLVAIGRRYGVGFEALVNANPGVDPWLPGAGTRIVIPSRYVLPDAPRAGIVLNVPEMRLYYYPPAKQGEAPEVMTYPISVGRMDWKTPLGRTRIAAKVRDPAWYPPESIRAEHAADGRPLPKVVPAGPDNPLGQHALRLAIPGYLIHGTNKPAGVGMRVTHGCLRMFPEDVEALFAMVPVGTTVHIVDQPFKLGHMAGTLYLEVHPYLEEDQERAASGLTAITRLLVRRTDDSRPDIDWDAVDRIYREARGIPEPMTLVPVAVADAEARLDSWCEAGSTACEGR